jgi:hypothetical protein
VKRPTNGRASEYLCLAANFDRQIKHGRWFSGMTESVSDRKILSSGKEINAMNFCALRFIVGLLHPLLLAGLPGALSFIRPADKYQARNDLTMNIRCRPGRGII